MSQQIVWGQKKRQTLADRAFLTARPAAFLTCRGEFSFPTSADSINIYAGYI
jgi:hypothetical protein